MLDPGAAIGSGIEVPRRRELKEVRCLLHRMFLVSHEDQAHTWVMAWEWVAPMATGITGIAGVTFTWLAGHQGRRHAEEVARQNSTAQRALTREARQAEAYLEILTLTNAMTAAVAQLTAIYRDRPNPDLPALDKQVEVSAMVGLYGSQVVRDAYQKWFEYVKTLLQNHEEITTNLKRPIDNNRNPDLWQQQEVARKAMRETADKLRELMNGELSS